jgi:hypothetical protein
VKYQQERCFKRASAWLLHYKVFLQIQRGVTLIRIKERNTVSISPSTIIEKPINLIIKGSFESNGEPALISEQLTQKKCQKKKNNKFLYEHII